MVICYVRSLSKSRNAMTNLEESFHTSQLALYDSLSNTNQVICLCSRGSCKGSQQHVLLRDKNAFRTERSARLHWASEKPPIPRLVTDRYLYAVQLKTLYTDFIAGKRAANGCLVDARVETGNVQSSVITCSSGDPFRFLIDF